jgi:N-acetyltransferase
MVWPVPAAAEMSGRWVRVTPLDPVADASALFAALDHDPVWEHLAGRPDGPEQLARMLLTRHAASDWQQWLVRASRPVAGLSTDAVIGTTSYLEASAHDARLEIGSTAYTPATWGTVVNPEVKLLLLAYAFDTLKAGRVQLKTDVRNVRSQEAIARLGAQYEGTLRRYQRRSDGSVRDTVLFSITAEDWPAVRRGLAARLRRMA